MLLCALNGQGDHDQVETLVARTARDTASSSESSFLRRWSARLASTGAAPTPHQRLTAAGPKAPDLVIEFSSYVVDDREAMIGEAIRIAGILGSSVDRQRSTAFVGTEVAITAGSGPIFVLMPLRRKASLTQSEFMSRWFDQHAALGQEVPGVCYRQNHADVLASAALADRLRFSGEVWDGIALSYFPTLDHGLQLMSQQRVLDNIEDERSFVDHDRSSFDFYVTLEELGPANRSNT